MWTNGWLTHDGANISFRKISLQIGFKLVNEKLIFYFGQVENWLKQMAKFYDIIERSCLIIITIIIYYIEMFDHWIGYN